MYAMNRRRGLSSIFSDSVGQAVVDTTFPAYGFFDRTADLWNYVMTPTSVLPVPPALRAPLAPQTGKAMADGSWTPDVQTEALAQRTQQFHIDVESGLPGDTGGSNSKSACPPESQSWNDPTTWCPTTWLLLVGSAGVVIAMAAVRR